MPYVLQIDLSWLDQRVMVVSIYIPDTADRGSLKARPSEKLCWPLKSYLEKEVMLLEQLEYHSLGFFLPAFQNIARDLSKKRVCRTIVVNVQAIPLPRHFEVYCSFSVIDTLTCRSK